MIQIHTTMTGKGYSPKEEYTIFGDSTEVFENIEKAKEALTDRYGNCKRSNMYQDTKQGTQHIGYIYHYRDSDISHLPVQKWLAQDWVSFASLTPIAP